MMKKGILIKAEKIPEELPPGFRGGILEKTGAKSVVIAPLAAGDKVIGNMLFASCGKRRKWPNDTIRRIKLIGEIIANAISRRRSVDALDEEMKSRYLLEEKYRSIIKSANVGFVLSDHDQNILDVNDEYCRMSGYSRDELIKLRIADLDYSDNPESKVTQDGVLTINNENGLFQHATRHIHKSGRIFDVEVSTQYLENEGEFFSFVRDVTELKIARKDLEDRLEFEALTSEFSAALINLKLEKIDEELYPWVRKYVEFFNVERGIINEYNYDSCSIEAIATYTDPDVDVSPAIKSDRVPRSVMENLARGIVLRAEKIPEELPRLFNMDLIRRHHTKSLVVVPLSAENQIIGNLAFATYTRKHEWPDELVRRMRLIGEIIANAILRKRSNDALIEEIKSRHMLEKKYTTIIKNASVGFKISDHDQNILDVNDEYCRMSGYTRDELTKMKISDIDFSRSAKKVDDDLAVTVAVGFLHHQSRHVRKDGSVFDVDIHSQYSKSEGFFFSFVRDVTELNIARKELEDRLKFEELTSEFSAALVNVKVEKARTELDVWLERLSELLHFDRCSIGEYSEDYSTYRFVCRYANPALRSTLPPIPEILNSDASHGLERYLMKGEALKLEKTSDRVPEDLRRWKDEILADGTKSILMLPLISGDTLLGSVTFGTLTHEQKWSPDLVRRLRLVAEIYANTLMRDRKDQELRNYQNHLERMVDERTARLEEAQKELVVRERMATLGRLTATVSHELRNPLGTIRASVYSAKKRLGGRNEKISNSLDRAERNIKRCDLIIDELLNYSRVQDLKLEAVPIDQWLSEVLEETTLPEGVSIRKEFKAGAVIQMDRERVRRSVVNILTNAYQSILEKEADEPGCVRIVTGRKPGNLVVEISDNGVGFDMKNREKLYEPLYSTKAFGVGLGIPITRQIFEQHGWHMDITGEPQKGASVIVTIPL